MDAFAGDPQYFDRIRQAQGQFYTTPMVMDSRFDELKRIVESLERIEALLERIATPPISIPSVWFPEDQGTAPSHTIKYTHTGGEVEWHSLSDVARMNSAGERDQSPESQ